MFGGLKLDVHNLKDVEKFAGTRHLAWPASRLMHEFMILLNTKCGKSLPMTASTTKDIAKLFLDRFRARGKDFIAFNDQSNFNLTRMVLILAVRRTSNVDGSEDHRPFVIGDHRELDRATRVFLIWEDPGSFGTEQSTEQGAPSGESQVASTTRYILPSIVPSGQEAQGNMKGISFQKFVSVYLYNNTFGIVMVEEQKQAYNRLVAGLVKKILDKTPSQTRCLIHQIKVPLSDGVDFQLSEIIPPSGSNQWNHCKNIRGQLSKDDPTFQINPDAALTKILDDKLLVKSTIWEALWRGLTALGAQAWRILRTVYVATLAELAGKPPIKSDSLAMTGKTVLTSL